MLDPITQTDSDDEKGRKKNKNRAPEKDVIPEEVINYAGDFVGKSNPDWKLLTRTLEEIFDGRNLSKLKLNDVDHQKKKIKKEYNEQALLEKMSKVDINDKGNGS